MWKLAFVGWMALCGGDAVTTHIGIGGSGREVVLSSNEFTSQAMMIGAEGAAGTAMVWERTHHHQKRAWVELAILSSIKAIVDAHNIHVINQMRGGGR